MRPEILGEPISDNLSKDQEYSRLFWERMTEGKRPEYRENKRLNMMEIINDAVTKQKGRFSLFVTRSPEGKFDEADRENISAYREVAKEMGYILGPVTHNGGNETASGMLVKIKP